MITVDDIRNDELAHVVMLISCCVFAILKSKNQNAQSTVVIIFVCLLVVFFNRESQFALMREQGHVNTLFLLFLRNHNCSFVLFNSHLHNDLDEVHAKNFKIEIM